MLSEFLRPVSRGRLFWLATALTLLTAGFTHPLGAQKTVPAAPKLSDQPLGAEQLAVYRFILTGPMKEGPDPLSLVAQTDPFPTEAAFDTRECLKGLDLEAYDPVVVHRFRPEDLTQLGPVRLHLVEREAQQKEVEKNDPSKSIQQGNSVEDAVRNGFAHGYAWVSEIRFDKSHTHAVVSYGFHCGELCGNGGTEILEKADGAWKFKSSCSSWIS